MAILAETWRKQLTCLYACLPACLHTCLLVCLLAFLFACLLVCLLACLLACLLLHIWYNGSVNIIVSDELVITFEIRVTNWAYNSSLGDPSSPLFVQLEQHLCSTVNLTVQSDYSKLYLGCKVSDMRWIFFAL